MFKDLSGPVQGKTYELYDTQIYANYMIFPGNVPNIWNIWGVGDLNIT